MYILEEYLYNQLEYIKNDWEKLSKGYDMTFYQSYDWYYMLRNYLLKDNFLHKNVFYVCRNEKKDAVLIAPLWVLHHSVFWPFNRKGIYILGRDGSSDYLNFIYNDFNPEVIDFLLHELSKKYHINHFKFEQLKEATALYNYIITKKVVRNHPLISVSLDLPDSEEEYLSILSKSTKQNLRTANNRLKKDKLFFEYVLDDYDVDKTICLQLKNSRLDKKNYEPDWRKRIKNWFFKTLTIKFPDYIPFLTEADTHIMSVYCEGQLAAFFNYGIDPYRKVINIMTAGTNEAFARYSPGMLLMFEFIKRTISHHKEIKNIDFTRGNEYYKYALGGKNHIIHSLRFTL